MTEQRLQEQRAQAAARDYITGVGMRQEMLELTDRMLAKKFEVSNCVIKRVRAHAKVTVLSEAEQQLVRQCAREHDRLEARLIYFTKAYLAKHHQVPGCAIDRELERLGFKNPLNRKAKAGEGAA